MTNFQIDTSNLRRISQEVKELLEAEFPIPSPELRQAFLQEVAALDRDLERQDVELKLNGDVIGRVVKFSFVGER